MSRPRNREPRFNYTSASFSPLGQTQYNSFLPKFVDETRSEIDGCSINTFVGTEVTNQEDAEIFVRSAPEPTKEMIFTAPN